MKSYTPYLLLLFCLLCLPLKLLAQEEVIANAKNALQSGSTKDLTRHLHTTIELKFEDDENDMSLSDSYSKTQAEYVLRDFFKKNPPQNFEYVHQGSSKEGMKYTIGKYTYVSQTGKVGYFRVFMKIKRYEGKYQIDELDFSKEN